MIKFDFYIVIEGDFIRESDLLHTKDAVMSMLGEVDGSRPITVLRIQDDAKPEDVTDAMCEALFDRVIENGGELNSWHRDLNESVYSEKTGEQEAADADERRYGSMESQAGAAYRADQL